LNEADWQLSDASPLSTIADHFSGNPVGETETLQYVEVDGGLCLQTTVPIHTNVYNRETEKVEPQVFGKIIARQRIESVFSATIAKLSGMDVNIFSGQEKLNAGTLPEYTQLAGFTHASADTTRSVDTQPFVSNQITINDNGYFQAALPLHDGSRVTGWVSAVVSRETVAANTRQMVLLMGLVYLGCLVVVLPLVYLFAASFSRLVNNVVGGLKDIAEGEGDLTRRLQENSKDELGDLARLFNIFIQRLQGIIMEIAENAGRLGASSADLKGLSEKMATSATDMSSQSQAVDDSTHTLSSLAEELNRLVGCFRV
jgi:methyl-accepting chemotaxis protein